MKRYLAFYGDYYYPDGGMDDFIGEHDTIKEAKETIIKAHLLHRKEDVKWEWAWCQIWDTETQKEVFKRN